MAFNAHQCAPHYLALTLAACECVSKQQLSLPARHFPTFPSSDLPPVLCLFSALVMTSRLLCVFSAGGEHLQTLGAEGGSSVALQQLSWLGEHEVLACSGEEITVWRISQDKYEELRTFAASNKAPIRHIATSPNGRYIAAACENGAVSVRGLFVGCWGRRQVEGQLPCWWAVAWCWCGNEKNVQVSTGAHQQFMMQPAVAAV